MKGPLDDILDRPDSKIHYKENRGPLLTVSRLVDKGNVAGTRGI